MVEICTECGDGFEGVKAITPIPAILDFPRHSNAQDQRGFKMLELIENPPAIILTTAFDRYAMKAFWFHALDYLQKPFKEPLW